MISNRCPRSPLEVSWWRSLDLLLGSSDRMTVSGAGDAATLLESRTHQNVIVTSHLPKSCHNSVTERMLCMQKVPVSISRTEKGLCLQFGRAIAIQIGQFWPW